VQSKSQNVLPKRKKLVVNLASVSPGTVEQRLVMIVSFVSEIQDYITDMYQEFYFSRAKHAT
jgi:hypothetical protein